MLCIGAGWEGGYGLTIVVVFFACFHNKNQEECLRFYLIDAGLKFLLCQDRKGM